MDCSNLGIENGGSRDEHTPELHQAINNINQQLKLERVILSAHVEVLGEPMSRRMPPDTAVWNPQSPRNSRRVVLGPLDAKMLKVSTPFKALDEIYRIESFPSLSS